MSVKDLRYFGDPVLTSPSDPVTRFDKSLRALVEDLLDTVRRPGRAGLAAPQIGVGLRAFSYNVDGKIGYVLNPEVVELSEQRQDGPEACLSVPGLGFPTERAMYAVVRGVNADNEPVEVSGEGLMARCLQHETDHLNGMLYLDRLDKATRRQALRQVRESDWFGVDTRVKHG
ncbi:peptide deformylase [Kutzneria albida]|uniref:Peptide deformylase n=1 Tax=Kutzneria albida DSM 43870 TaxID=1449976 RepID=W5W998_9PSEU|nr:peptide deformylase [Kutzneria albida]AHH94764.1 peptide deformylase [Kutzneria albida DSM 43870]